MRVYAVRVLAAAAAALGLLHLLAGTVPPHGDRPWRHAVTLVDGAPTARPQAVLFGLLMLVLAHGLAGRRRLARQLAIAGLALAGVVSLHTGPVRVAALGAALLVLVALGAEFPARPDARRLRLAGQLGVGVLGLVGAGSGWILAVDRDRPRDIGQAVLAGFNAADIPHMGHGGTLAVLAGSGGVAVLLLLFAAAPPPAPGSAADRAWVTALAGRPGADSLAPFATRRDKSYVFSPDHRAAIGYRVLFGTALAGGDPVGDPGSTGTAVDAFVDLCRRRGWRPAVLGASGPALPHWRRHGLHGLVVGDEAVLDPATFGLGSRRMRNVRQAVRRSHNAGVTVTIGPLTPALAERLRPVVEDWLGGQPERGFAMNLDALLTPRPDCLIAVGWDAAGEPAAFARFAVCADGSVLTLDVAPRRADAPNGVVERLVVDVVEWGRAHGAAEVSLNFAGLRRVFEATGPAGRAARLVVHAFDRWIELGPLYRFCAKFQPAWRPRSLLLSSWLAIGPVALAALAAEFGGGGPVPVEPEPVDEPVDVPSGATRPAVE